MFISDMFRSRHLPEIKISRNFELKEVAHYQPSQPAKVSTLYYYRNAQEECQNEMQPSFTIQQSLFISKLITYDL